MRFPNGLLVGLAGLTAVALVGCSGSAPASAPAPGSALAPVSSSSAATKPIVTQTGPPEPKTKAGAHAAAADFYRLYSAAQFGASWDLLTPVAQQAIPLATWVGVHNGCLSANGGMSRLIKSVLVFSSTAIVTETIADAGSRLGKAKAYDVFNYVDGHWGYAPNDLNIYGHGSVAADIAAAKAQGFCTTLNASPL
jgi:hypothetical protein